MISEYEWPSRGGGERKKEKRLRIRSCSTASRQDIARRERKGGGAVATFRFGSAVGPPISTALSDVEHCRPWLVMMMHIVVHWHREHLSFSLQLAPLLSVCVSTVVGKVVG